MSNLQARLQEARQRYELEILAIVAEETEGVVAKPAAARAPATAPVVARAKPVESGKRRRRTAEQIEAVLVEVIEALKGSEDGAGIEWLHKRTNIEKADLSRALSVGLESHQLQKVGERRATKYVLPSQAQAKGRVIKKKRSG